MSAQSTRQLQMMRASSEYHANEIDDRSFEESLEVGMEAALSHSQVEFTGEQLMAAHLGKRSSTYFKAVRAPLEAETDELKCRERGRTSDAGVHDRPGVLNPNPIILVNDAELILSPLSPPHPATAPDDTQWYPDPEEEVRKILMRKLDVVDDEGDGVATLTDVRPDSRCSTGASRTRRESAQLMQRLQMKNKLPKLGGEVRSSLQTYSLFRLDIGGL